jgi:hypothetical protein
MSRRKGRGNEVASMQGAELPYFRFRLRIARLRNAALFSNAQRFQLAKTYAIYDTPTSSSRASCLKDEHRDFKYEH